VGGKGGEKYYLPEMQSITKYFRTEKHQFQTSLKKYQINI
jgi:hypothetical protein